MHIPFPCPSPSPSPTPQRCCGTATTSFMSGKEKSASALIAVARVLERRRPLDGGEDEFLALYARAAAAKPSLFTRVWTDPGAYFWVRMAYQLVATCVSGAALTPLADAYCRAVGADDPRQALARHLEDFKRFMLALHLLERSECRFTSPLRTRLPMTIPATRLTIEGEGLIEISRLARRRLEVVHGGERLSLPLAAGRGGASAALRVVEYPEVGHAGVRLTLQPPAFDLPGLDFAAPAIDAGLDVQLRHRLLIARTLALIQAHQRRTFVQFREVMRTIALKPRRAGTYTNITHSDLPGAFIASVVENPYELADTFIHEFHHNRLFFIEERGAFFDSAAENALTGRGHYSPWRDDPRPLHGLFHAVYVALPVVRFWLDVHATGGVDPTCRAYAVDRILRGIAQLELGVAELERSASLSAFGRTLFDQMKLEVADLRHDIGCSYGLPSDAPAIECRDDGAFEPEISKLTGKPLTVREAVEEHVRRFTPAPLSTTAVETVR